MDEHSSLSESQINGTGNGSLGTKTNDSKLNSADFIQADGSGTLGSGVRLDAVGNEIGHHAKRGRGRPRKVEGAVPKSGMFLPQPLGISPASANIAKRGRGRPKGSGPKQLLAASGGRAGGETEANFIPHIVHVRSEEDIYHTIRSFAQRGPRSICVLSATGLVSSVVLCHPDSNMLKYDGPFEIITLNGCIIESSMLLSISLAKSDGTVFGGAVVGPIIAACPIQLLVASFTPNISKEVKNKYAVGPSSAANSFVSPDVANGSVYYPSMLEADDMCNTPASAPPGLVMKPNNFMVQTPNFNYNPLQNVDPRTLLSQTQQSMEDELISRHPNNGIP